MGRSERARHPRLVERLRLIVVSPGAAASLAEDPAGAADALEAFARDAFQGGATAFWLREHVLATRHLHCHDDARRRLRRLSAATGTLLIESDPHEAAGRLPAAVRFRSADLARDPAAARALRDRGVLVGVSAHDPTPDPAALAAADYATLSPLFATASHPQAQPLGVARFAELRRAMPLPVVALGGIGPDTAAAAIRAGADGVAVLSAAFRAKDRADAVSRLRDAVERALP